MKKQVKAEEGKTEMKVSIHKNITRTALKEELSKSALDFVCEANEESDALYNQSNSAQHFDDSKIKEGLTFIKKLEKALLSELTSVPSYTGKVREGRFLVALYALGRLLHAIQDFYSHSNWVNHTGPVCPIWNEKIDMPNRVDKNLLKTGYFSISTEGTKIVASAVCSTGVGVVERYLSENPDYYRKYLTAETMYHRELNKDRDGTLADLSFKHKYNISGFEVVFETAKNHTATKWSMIKEGLKDSVGVNVAKAILNELKTWEPTLSVGRALWFGRTILENKGIFR